MDIIKINEVLQENVDKKYRIFSAKLLPEKTKILGIRLPFLRKLAKQIVRENWESFLIDYKPDYLEERLLLGFVIAYAPVDLLNKLELIRNFVPLINNWSVCDSFCASFKFNNNDKKLLWEFIVPYFTHKGEYARRFAIVMSLNYLLDDNFIDNVLSYLSAVNSEEYYVQMSVAWALAEVYVKYPAKVDNLLCAGILNIDIHNKTIQKVRESLRIDKSKKDELLKLRRIK